MYLLRCGLQVICTLAEQRGVLLRELRNFLDAVRDRRFGPHVSLQ